MKVNFRSRKVVLQNEFKAEPRNLQTPSRFPPNRIIIRKQPKQQEEQKQTPSNTVDEQQDKIQQEDNITPLRTTKQYFGDYSPQSQFLQARDRRTVLRYDFKQKHFNLQRQKERLNEWLGEMHFNVVSASFNLYLTNQLTFQEVKVHCCQNLLLNILNFLQILTQPAEGASISRVLQTSKPGISYIELTQVLKHINQTLNKNFSYMLIKYPLTKDTKPNKSLQSLISKIDNLGNDQHDVLMKSGVEFKLKQEDNYTPQIMKFLNFIIYKQAQLCKIRSKNNKKELTYFEFFYQTMERIFSLVYKPEYEVKEANTQKQVEENPAALFARIMSGNLIEEEEDDGNKNKELKQYKEKVLKYTHYLIGQKFPSNIEPYSESQIQTQIFDVKNSSILRVLTKWTEQLQKKILNAQQQILKRPFRFKKCKNNEFAKLNANQKNDLFLQTKRRAKEVNQFNEQLKENYNQIEAMLSSHLKQEASMKNIPKNQYKVGFFCSKIQAAASSTLLSYLNKIIHILLQIPNQLKEMHHGDPEYLQNMDINLITFKISDLFRCKIKSREAQIVRILKEIKSISQKGEPFKIVRIKDRLNLGTRDILINVIFMNLFLCQIQLAVEEYVQAKQMSFDSFSHFLYQMDRSRLGPIMESACTWAQFDQRSKIFRAINQTKNKDICKFIAHTCGKDFLIDNKYPFVCTLCQKFYSSQQGLVKHRKCNMCRTHFECSLCIFSKMSDKEVAQLIGLKERLGQEFMDDFKLWKQNETTEKQFPKFGLLTSKKMKKSKIVFFQTIIFKYDAYIIRTLDTAQIQIIQTISGNSPKNWRKVIDNFIIYEWKEKKSINLTITPQSIKEALDNDKKKKQQTAKIKKEQRDKKKAELGAKRKEEEERRRAYFQKEGKDKEDKDKDKDKEKEKEKEKHGSESDQQSNISKKQKKATTAPQKTIINVYHQKLSKKNQAQKSRVIMKQLSGFNHILVLSTFLSESVIRNKLKQKNNQNILQKLSTQKIQVLFLEDEYIHNQINEGSYLSEAEVTELKQTLQRVSEVYFDNNFIEDLLFFSQMNNLKVAHFSHNKIQNLAPLQKLKHISQLILQNNHIYDLSTLKNKPQLLELNLNRNFIDNLSFLNEIEPNSDFNRLKHFYISDNSLTSMEGLDKLVGLVKIDISYNQIDEISAFESLTGLKQLDISYNTLTTLKGIKNYTGLVKLIANKNKIKVMSNQLVFLQNLSYLDLSSNRITKIKNINTGSIAKSIKYLNLSGNQIGKMEGMQNLQNLHTLNLSYNQISAIGDNYLDFGNLVVWDMSHNCIEDLTLEQVKEYLPNLKELYLNQNPFSSSPSNLNIAKILSQMFKNISIQFNKNYIPE